MKARFSAALLLAVLSASRAALASNVTVYETLSALSCHAEERLARELKDLALPPEHSVHVNLNRTDAGYISTITSSGRVVRERIVGPEPTCDDVLVATVLIVRLLADEVRRIKTTTPKTRKEPELQPSVPPPLQKNEPLEPPPPTSRARWRGSRWTFDAHVGQLAGVDEAATLVTSVGLHWAPRPSWGIRALAWWAPEATVAFASGNISHEAYAVSFAGCPQLLAYGGRLLAYACLGPLMGTRFGRGRGYAIDRSGRLPWVSIETDAGLRVFALFGLALDVRVSAMIPLRYDVFRIDGIGSLYGVSPLHTAIGLGLSYTLD